MNFPPPFPLPSGMDDHAIDEISTDRSHTLNLQAEVEAALARLAEEAQAMTDIDRRVVERPTVHPDAVSPAAPIIPTVDTKPRPAFSPPVDTLTGPPEGDRAVTLVPTHDLVAGGPKLLRDRVALLAVVRYRLLPLRQLHALVFAGTDKAVISRRVQALVRGGLVTIWEEHLVVGGRPRWVLPTKRGLAWAQAELRAEAVGTPHEQLLSVMLDASDPRPLVLAPRTAPPLLPHQAETNALVAALAADPALGITWASTWHRPLPNMAEGLAMPQPDAVLVAERDGAPHLVFLEHDRSQEAPASFQRRKAARYADLALFGIARRLLGFSHFTVWVTVADPAGRPLARMRALQAVSRGATMLRFTLADWVLDETPSNPIWWAPSTANTTPDGAPTVADTLAGPFAELHQSAESQDAAELYARIRAANLRDAAA